MDAATGLPFALGGFGSPRLFEVAMPASVGNNYRQFTRAIVTFEDLAWDERSERPAQPAGGRTAVP
jgi:hypothetical protein